MDISVFILPIIIPLIVAVGATLLFFVGYIKGRQIGRGEGKSHQERSRRFTRSVLGGLFSEQVAPFLPNFPPDLKASEARFIGKPVDFLIFKGMDEKNITEVVFVEVKTGNAHLTTNEHNLRDVINARKVRWCEYHVDREVSDLKSEIT